LRTITVLSRHHLATIAAAAAAAAKLTCTRQLCDLKFPSAFIDVWHIWGLDVVFFIVSFFYSPILILDLFRFLFSILISFNINFFSFFFYFFYSSSFSLCLDVPCISARLCPHPVFTTTTTTNELWLLQRNTAIRSPPPSTSLSVCVPVCECVCVCVCVCVYVCVCVCKRKRRRERTGRESTRVCKYNRPSVSQNGR